MGKQAIGLVVNLEPKYPATDVRKPTSPRPRRADAYMNRQYLDPALLRPRIRRSLREIFGEAWPTFPAADFDAIRQPIDFSRHQLLHARASCATIRRAWPIAAPRACASPRAHTETEWEVYPRGPRRTSCSGCATATARCRSTSPRTAPPSTIRRAAERRPRRGSAPRGLPARPPARARSTRVDARRRPARLLRLVAARQLRVVARLLEALRPRPRRLRDAEAHAQGERALLLRGHRHGRRGALDDPSRTGDAARAARRSADSRHVPCELAAVAPSTSSRRGRCALDLDLPASRRARGGPSRALPRRRQAGVEAQARPTSAARPAPTPRRRGGARRPSRCTRSSRRGRGAASRARRRCRAGRTARPSSGRGPWSTG